MKINELIKELKKSGFCYLVRHGSNHDIWHSDKTGLNFQVPRHQSKELKKGTEQNIRRQAGL